MAAAQKKHARTPVTRAVIALREAGIQFGQHPYPYEDRGGTKVSSRELGVAEHCVIKTLVMEDEAARPLIVLMHGDRTVSTKQLARQLGVKRVTPCTPQTAERHTGYQVGGTSPFGTRRPLKVYIETSIIELERLYINGGKRGFLVSMNPESLELVLPELVFVDVAKERRE